LRVGLLKEGFHHQVSDQATSAKVRAAANDLKASGAVVEEVSVPMHLEGALANCDVLAMPTIPFPATEIPPPDAPREVYVDAALNMQQNTCPFDVSGHPAFTVPCGKVDGLPVGIMLVGRHFEETTVIQAAQALEQAGDWRTR
jgi:Asp-tRNA(Asn)/Glu-tRNA(Gln) amidotransferase A subunit family amidase